MWCQPQYGVSILLGATVADGIRGDSRRRELACFSVIRGLEHSRGLACAVAVLLYVPRIKHCSAPSSSGSTRVQRVHYPLCQCPLRHCGPPGMQP